MKSRTNKSRTLMSEMLKAIFEERIEEAESKLTELVRHTEKVTFENGIHGLLLQKHRAHANKTIAQIAKDSGFPSFSDHVESICEKSIAKFKLENGESKLGIKVKIAANKRKAEQKERAGLIKKPKAKGNKLIALDNVIESMDENATTQSHQIEEQSRLKHQVKKADKIKSIEESEVPAFIHRTISLMYLS